MRILLAALALLGATGVEAHRPSDAYLTLTVDGARVQGQWEIALRDLALLTELDRDGDRALTWGELRAGESALRLALGSSLRLDSDGQACPLEIGELLVNERSDGRYGWFALTADCAGAPSELGVDYRLLFDLDPSHRGLLVLHAGTATHSAVFEPARSQRTLRLAEVSRLRQFGEYFRQGVHHIWVGLDHVLFLVVLLLPAVLVRREARWRAAPTLRPVLWDVVRVVTAFTLAHSVTLGLAAFGVIRLPGALVESVIALSVLLAALNNVWPVLDRARAAVAASFGLIHGFGFASVLGELGLPDDARLLALLAFNLGVEAGQMAIVAAFLPLAWWLRRSAFYRCGVLVAGSLAAALIAAWWLLQRAGVIAA